MAVGSDITHLQKQLASWVRIPITAPSLCRMYGAEPRPDYNEIFCSAVLSL